jgi:ubiquinone/menaquinone biosynthesis C-methylase UbiE
MNNYWIHEQTDRNISQFEKAMETHYPESAAYLHDPKEYLARVGEQCNYIDAIKLIDWRKYLRPDCSILDLGGGAGWLSAYLSQFESVGKIYNLDSSKFFLYEMMPSIVELMAGHSKKITPIEGLFSPLLFEDQSLEVVAASSALHHADNLEDLLKEIRRVLKKGGWLFALNETPYTATAYAVLAVKVCVKMFRDIAFRRYKSVSPSISSCGYRYDPYLGDIAYPTWYWQAAFKRAGFTLVECVDSGMATVKGWPGLNLVHFICRAD